MKQTVVYIVRHGETVDNAAQIMQGQTQGELNETGISQAEELAARIEGMEVDAIVSSDLHRAVQTAEIIAAALGLEVRTTPLLRERDWGDFTGMYIPDLKGLPFPENVETMEQLRQRAANFLDMMRQDYRGKRVIAVGHGIMHKVIQAVFYDKLTREIPRMANAEIRELILQ